MAETALELRGASKSKLVSLVEQGERKAASALASARRFKERSVKPLKMLAETTVCVAGGGLDGALEVYMPEIGNTGAPTAGIAGLIAVGIGASGIADPGTSTIALELGKGLLAARGSRMFENLIRARQ